MPQANTLADVEEVLDRARRLSGNLRAFKGEGATWEYTFPDGISERYTITDVMPIERLMDNVRHVFIWLWATKDYLNPEALGSTIKQGGATSVSPSAVMQ